MNPLQTPNNFYGPLMFPPCDFHQGLGDESERNYLI